MVERIIIHSKFLLNHKIPTGDVSLQSKKRGRSIAQPLKILEPSEEVLPLFPRLHNRDTVVLTSLTTDFHNAPYNLIQEGDDKYTYNSYPYSHRAFVLS